MNIHEFKVDQNKPRLQIPALTVLRGWSNDEIRGHLFKPNQRQDNSLQLQSFHQIYRLMLLQMSLEHCLLYIALTC